MSLALAARLTAVCAVGVLAVALLMSGAGVQLWPLTLASSPEAAVVYAQQHKTAIEKSIGYDWLFIVFFTLMFLGYALLHKLRGATTLAIATAACTLITAACDVMENKGVLDVVQGKAAPALYAASTAKWLAFSIVLLLCAMLFLRSGNWLRFVGGFLAAVGVAGAVIAVSLIFGNGWAKYVALPLFVSFLPLGVATLVFFFRPSALR